MTLPDRLYRVEILQPKQSHQLFCAERARRKYVREATLLTKLQKATQLRLLMEAFGLTLDDETAAPAGYDE
jgi:hypothetical protein